MWTVVALFVIAIAFMLLMGVQDDIPENIRGLWNRPGAEAPAQPPSRAQGPVPLRARVEGWEVLREGANVELARDLSGPWNAGALRYDAPTLMFTCYGNTLYARLATRLASAGAQHTAVTVDGHDEQWARAPGNFLYSPAPATLLQHLLERTQPVNFGWPVVELGSRTFRLDPQGLRAASQALPAACRPR